MTAINVASGAPVAPGLLDRERIVARAGFNRWLVPPAALCIHLCIGMAYGFSVFWLPLSRAIGLSAPKACPVIASLPPNVVASPGHAIGFGAPVERAIMRPSGTQNTEKP